MNRQLFLDMDGVICDFDKKHLELLGVLPDRQDHSHDRENKMWKIIQEYGTFFLDLEPMEDFYELWDFAKHHNPIILTGIPYIKNAAKHKREWIAKHVDPNIQVITCKSKDKCLHANPGDVLLDDWPKYQHLFEEMGGIFVLHTNAKSSIQKLKDLGFN